MTTIASATPGAHRVPKADAAGKLLAGWMSAAVLLTDLGLGAGVAGDLLYGSGANTLARLGIGGAGQLLIAGASAPAWSGTGLTYASNTLSLVGSGGITTLQAATQDAVKILGRAGGTNSRTHTITTSALTASRAATLPDADIVFAGSAAPLTSGRIPTVTTGGLLVDSAGLLWDTSGAIYNRVVAVVGTGSCGWSSDDGTRKWMFGSNTGIFQVYDVTGGASKLQLSTTTMTLQSNMTGGLVIQATTGTGLTVSSTTDATTTSDGSVRLSGGLSVAKAIVSGSTLLVGIGTSGNGLTVHHAMGQIGVNTYAGSLPSVGDRIAMWAFGATAANTARAAITSFATENWASGGVSGCDLRFEAVAIGGTSSRTTVMQLSAAQISCNVTTDATTTSDGSVRLSGGLSVAKAGVFGGRVTALAATIPFLGERIDAGTSDTLDVANLRRGSSGTPATNYGASIRIMLHTSTNAFQDAALITGQWADVANATRKGRMVLSVGDASALREGFRLESNGTVPLLGFFAVTPVARQTVGAAATDAATTQTLANNLRTALINLGLCQN